jgi:hypothetical protein
MLQQTGPSTGSTAVELGPRGSTDSGSADADGHSVRDVRAPRKGGTAVQTGSVLTVNVFNPKANVVQITTNGPRSVEVEWNAFPSMPMPPPRRAIRTFTGVETIIVHTHIARKDQVTLEYPNMPMPPPRGV